MTYFLFFIGVLALSIVGHVIKETYRHYALKAARNKAEDKISVYVTETEIVNNIVELIQLGHLEFNRYYNDGVTTWLSKPKGKVLIIKSLCKKVLDVYICNQEVKLNNFEQTRIRTALGGERD